MRQILVGLFSLSFSLAALAAPPCLDGNREMPIDNDRVLELKRSTPNQFHARARIEGVVAALYRDTTNHDRFSVQIGPNRNDTIEIVYNQEFGALPYNMPTGAPVEVCGDFINSFERAGRYPPSPDGAIIHWVHASNNPQKHPHGYVILDGREYGGDSWGGGSRNGNNNYDRNRRKNR